MINRLLGRKMAKSRNLPGVTKSLQWVRIGGRELEGLQENALELLDSPGIIPARQLDQEGALKLAICNDIGEASYDRVVVAAALCDRVNDLHRRCGSPAPPSTHFTSLSHTLQISPWAIQPFSGTAARTWRCGVSWNATACRTTKSPANKSCTTSRTSSTRYGRLSPLPLPLPPLPTRC